MTATKRKINVYTGDGYDTIHPETTASQVEGLGDALDAYKIQFIDPEIEKKVETVNSLKPDSKGNVLLYYKQKDGDEEAAKAYSKAHKGVFVYVTAAE